MTSTERRYRRVLRLLPAGYRQLWEEDMVSTYLDAVTDSPRRSAGEWLAVVWLALGLRLNGSHAKPRADLWYQLALGIAILTTLYESLRATITFAVIAWQYATVEMDIGGANHVAYWWEAIWLVWVAAFVCLVLGRLVAARVLVLCALAHVFGLTSLIVTSTISPSLWGLPPHEYSTMHQAWVCLTAVTVFLVTRDVRPSRGWLAAYIAPALVIAPIAVTSAIDLTLVPHWVPQPGGRTAPNVLGRN